MDMKKIIMIGGIGLVVVGGGGYFFLNKPSAHESEETSESAPENKPAPEAPKTAPPPPPTTSNDEASFDVEETTPVTQTHIINMPGSKGGFLKCQISIMVGDEELGKKMMNAESPSPENTVAKAIVLDALKSLTEEDIFDNEAQQVLRENITEKLNQRIKLKPSTEKKAPPRPARPFKDVLITEWAVQR